MIPDDIRKKIEELGELILDYLYEQEDIVKTIKKLKNMGLHISITIDAYENLDEIMENIAELTEEDKNFLKKLKIQLPDDNHR